MTWVLIWSVPVGVALTEIALRGCSRCFKGDRVRSITQELKKFQQAQTDDARQALLLRAGSKTLLLSLGVLGVVAVLALVLCLPVWAVDLGSEDLMAYGTATSIAAAAWFVLRRWLPKLHPSAPSRAVSAAERDAQ
jgi:hypothetical protein